MGELPTFCSITGRPIGEAIPVGRHSSVDAVCMAIGNLIWLTGWAHFACSLFVGSSERFCRRKGKRELRLKGRGEVVKKEKRKGGDRDRTLKVRRR